MVFNTVTVGAAVTPAVIGTYLSHYLSKKRRHGKPTAHISYDEGIHLVRQFLTYASHHTVEDIQRFTRQWVPHPRWVKVDEVEIPQRYINDGAEALRSQLGREGIEKIGGKTWWEWRRAGSDLKAEWIEMRSDYWNRKEKRLDSDRVILYIHGGAYFFGSVDEHRYQMQRHARKLKGRVFAPRYRLAPQFPFPCGLHDCLSAYLYLISVQHPSTILLAGDSAGGGMVLSILVLLRDRGLPLPAGAILISPWVDLTHSLPSVGGDNPLDYIPPHGFQQRPSVSWPPPNADELNEVARKQGRRSDQELAATRATEHESVQGYTVSATPTAASRPSTIPGRGQNLSITIDGKLVEIKDQIQMYTTNELLAHPLVSPIMQPSLGGLPPLLIMTGGGEALRDEQIYLAHKAANPKKYRPGDAFLTPEAEEQIKQWKPTDVQLQVWDDLCHVAPTLSFTKPAKYMYRSVAQFGAWALARAQKSGIEILDDDQVSIISQSDANNSSKESSRRNSKHDLVEGATQVGKAGDPLPPFRGHMIRQRVTTNGEVYPLEPASQLAACTMDRNDIGVIKEAPVRKWMKAKLEWDTRYASSKRRVQKERAKEMLEWVPFEGGENPPPSALVGRRHGDRAPEEKNKKSWGMTLWSSWGSKHDKVTKKREINMDREADTVVVTEAEGANARPLHDTMNGNGNRRLTVSQTEASRSRSRRRTVTDLQQTEQQHEESDGELRPPETAVPTVLTPQPSERNRIGSGSTMPFPTYEEPQLILTPPIDDAYRGRSPPPPATLDSNIEYSKTNRPKSNGIAFPFSLRGDDPQQLQRQITPSMETLTSEHNVRPVEELGVQSALCTGLRLNTFTNSDVIGSSPHGPAQVHPATLAALEAQTNTPSAMTNGVPRSSIENIAASPPTISDAHFAAIIQSARARDEENGIQPPTNPMATQDGPIKRYGSLKKENGLDRTSSLRRTSADLMRKISLRRTPSQKNSPIEAPEDQGTENTLVREIRAKHAAKEILRQSGQFNMIAGSFVAVPRSTGTMEDTTGSTSDGVNGNVDSGSGRKRADTVEDYDCW